MKYKKETTSIDETEAAKDIVLVRTDTTQWVGSGAEISSGMLYSVAWETDLFFYAMIPHLSNEKYGILEKGSITWRVDPDNPKILMLTFSIPEFDAKVIARKILKDEAIHLPNLTKLCEKKTMKLAFQATRPLQPEVIPILEEKQEGLPMHTVFFKVPFVRKESASVGVL